MKMDRRGGWSGRRLEEEPREPNVGREHGGEG